LDVEVLAEIANNDVCVVGQVLGGIFRVDNCFDIVGTHAKDDAGEGIGGFLINGYFPPILVISVSNGRT